MFGDWPGADLPSLGVVQSAGGEAEGDGQDGDEGQDGEPDQDPADTSHQEDPGDREDPGSWQRQRDDPAGLGQVTEHLLNYSSDGEQSSQGRPCLLHCNLWCGNTDINIKDTSDFTEKLGSTSFKSRPLSPAIAFSRVYNEMFYNESPLAQGDD